MSLLVAWISRDQNKASAVYIAADSCISAGRERWKRGKKVFACKSQPWIGYCGLVLVPTQILAELTDAIDSGLVVDAAKDSPENWQAVKGYLEQALIGSEGFLSKDRSYIFAFNRTGESRFDAGYYTLDGTAVHFTHLTNNSKDSAVIKVLGSSEACFEEIAGETRAKNSSIDVARIFFASFCRAIQSGKVDEVGGAPQLATLRTKGNGSLIPILFEKVTFHQGVETDVTSYSGECFDETLQRIDPKTLQLPKGGQRQPLR